MVEGRNMDVCGRGYTVDGETQNDVAWDKSQRLQTRKVECTPAQEMEYRSTGAYACVVAYRRSSALNKQRNSPNPSQIILIQPTLPKDLNRGAPINKARPRRVPSPKYLIIALLLALGQRPGHPRRTRALDLLIVLLKALLEREPAELLLGLKQLRRASGVVRRGGVRGQECARHHLQPRVDEARDLGNQRLQPSTAHASSTREPGLLGHNARRRRRHESALGLLLLLGAEETARGERRDRRRRRALLLRVASGHAGEAGLLGLQSWKSGLLRLLERRSLAGEACRLRLQAWKACLLGLLERRVLAGEAGLHWVLVPCLALALSPLRHRR